MFSGSILKAVMYVVGRFGQLRRGLFRLSRVEEGGGVFGEDGKGLA
jgi:hypothetical protein